MLAVGFEEDDVSVGRRVLVSVIQILDTLSCSFVHSGMEISSVSCRLPNGAR